MNKNILKTTANMYFGAGDVRTRVGSRSIDELVDAMSGDIANAHDLVGLQDKLNGRTLNGVKAKVFGNQSPPSPPKLDYETVLAIVCLPRNPKIVSIFQAASRRVQAFWAKIDAACVGNRCGPCILGITWADEHMGFQSGLPGRYRRDHTTVAGFVGR